MPREKKAAAARPSTNAKGRHRLRIREHVGSRPTAGLVAKLDVPKISKHKTYFEFAENTDKKKKLEVKVTDKKEAPPGFTFVPFGNPELTSACKEISRENDAMIFIVSDKKEIKQSLSDHVHRLGYHFRSTIMEQASIAVGGIQTVRNASGYELRSQAQRTETRGDPIPATQEEINAQADGAIRDLFPRIPNTDREMIIQHAFQMGAVFMGNPVVGLQKDLTLSRRVQLAVIAHVRHTHTRYDRLLRETDWATARAMVEPVCLDIIVKWRGDEETGRDQLDEVLREVVVISDSEDSDDEDGDADESSSDDVQETRGQSVGFPIQLDGTGDQQRPQPAQTLVASNIQPDRPAEKNSTNRNSRPGPKTNGKTLNRKQARKARLAERKGFKRYRAWNEALNRQKQTSLNLEGPDNHLQHSSSQASRRDGFADNRDRIPVSSGYGHQQTAGPAYPVDPFSPGQSHNYLPHADHLTEANRSRKVVLPGMVPAEELYTRQPVRHVVDPYGAPQHFSGTSRRLGSYLDGMRSPAVLGLQDLLVPSIEKGPSEGTVISTSRNHPVYDERMPIPEARRYPAPHYARAGKAEPEEYISRNGTRYKRQRIADGENSSRMAIYDAPTVVSARDHHHEVSPRHCLRHASVSHDIGTFVDLTKSPQRANHQYSRAPHEQQPRIHGVVHQMGDPRRPVVLPARQHRELHDLDTRHARPVVSHNAQDPLPAHIIARENMRPMDVRQDRGFISRNLSHAEIPASHATIAASTRPLEHSPGHVALDKHLHPLSHHDIPGPVSSGPVEVYLKDSRYGRGTGFVRQTHQHPYGTERDFRESTVRPASPRPVFRAPAGHHFIERVPQTRLFEHQMHLPIYDAPPRGAIPVRRHPNNANTVRYDGSMGQAQPVRHMPQRDIVVLD